MGGRGLGWGVVLLLWMASGCGGGGGGGGGGGTGGELPQDEPGPEPLAVNAVYPSVGATRGSTLVTVTGQGFDDAVSVLFDDVPGNKLVVEDSYTLQVRTPPLRFSEGSVDVTVTTRGGGKGKLKKGFTYYAEVIEGLTWQNEGSTLHFQWSLSGPGSEIGVFRGATRIATLAGDALSFACQEEAMGVFKYTFSLSPQASGATNSRVVAIVGLGRLVWDPPPELVEGYYVYVAASADRFPAKESPSYVAGYRTEVSLRELYESGVIRGPGTVYFAVSSYYRPFISELSTPPVFTDYAVITDEAP